MGYKTGKNRADALARFQAIKDMMDRKTTPAPSCEPAPSSPYEPTPFTMDDSSQPMLGGTDFPTQPDYDALIDSFNDLRSDDAEYPCYTPYTHSIPPQPAQFEQFDQLIPPDQQLKEQPSLKATKLDESTFNASFEALVTTLEHPYLRYVTTIQKTSSEHIPHEEERPCQCETRTTRTRTINCYLYNGMSSNPHFY